MVLDNKSIDKIKAFVYAKPRAINEIAQMLNKNWRTADRYVDEIKKRTGHIQTKTFREGSRGALKIAYWNNLEKIYSTDIQEKLFKQIEKGIDKQDFSPIEIFQYVDADKRDGYFEEIKPDKKNKKYNEDYQYNVETLFPLIDNAKEEILIFIGTSSWIHLNYKDRTLFDAILTAAKRGVLIQILTNVNLLDKENLRKVMSINTTLGKEQVMIRHEITPLRAYIIDKTVAKFSEIKVPKSKPGELQKTLGVYYAFYDEDWVEWIRQMFWKKFQLAVPAKSRLDALESLHAYKGLK
ncbi:hypothetical protein HOK51_01115 [Candidatus Woesearchaeota archaeon]|jgi:hypothetical protein|nr:hypothetical protein [Candidatus Woesearchaeota archaeon]MBT6518414.1 hypothetical protein [Candidatus Woesearchaeota archaeon]MBT7366564.1 hypothetical protein [Candidatus Woesearchaeota archaeon]